MQDAALVTISQDLRDIKRMLAEHKVRVSKHAKARLEPLASEVHDRCKHSKCKKLRRRR